jgi:hypothetical protein
LEKWIESQPFTPYDLASCHPFFGRKIHHFDDFPNETFQKSGFPHIFSPFPMGFSHIFAGISQRSPCFQRTSRASRSEVSVAFSPRRCLFDKQHFNTIDQNLTYM